MLGLVLALGLSWSSTPAPTEVGSPDPPDLRTLSREPRAVLERRARTLVARHAARDGLAVVPGYPRERLRRETAHVESLDYLMGAEDLAEIRTFLAAAGTWHRAVARAARQAGVADPWSGPEQRAVLEQAVFVPLRHLLLDMRYREDIATLDPITQDPFGLLSSHRTGLLPRLGEARRAIDALVEQVQAEAPGSLHALVLEAEVHALIRVNQAGDGDLLTRVEEALGRAAPGLEAWWVARPLLMLLVTSGSERAVPHPRRRDLVRRVEDLARRDGWPRRERADRLLLRCLVEEVRFHRLRGGEDLVDPARLEMLVDAVEAGLALPGREVAGGLEMVHRVATVGDVPFYTRIPPPSLGPVLARIQARRETLTDG